MADLLNALDDIPPKHELRDYQVSAIERLRQSMMEGHKRPLLQLPTGGGKSAIAAAIINSALGKGKRVAFVVPALSLIDQTLQAFWRDGVRDMGVIQANHPETDWSRPVQVCSVQTLARRTFPKADLIIVDECHVKFKTIEDWIFHPDFTNARFIGLSATPWTKGLGNVWDDLIVIATTQDLIDKGVLSTFRVFAPSHPDLSGVRTQAGDYHEGDLSTAMDKPMLVADIVETWIKRGENRPTLLYGVDCAHAKHLQERFIAAGIEAEYIDAFTDVLTRKAIGRRFNAKELPIVCSVGTMIMGVDWDVRCIILARPTKSIMLHVQITGRGLRTAPGKEDLIILDHSDNTSRLGFVTDIGLEHLDMGEKKDKKEQERKEPLPKECPQCAYLRPAKIRICPNCGFDPKPISKTEEIDGELSEITRKKNKKLHRAGYIELRGREIPLGDFYGMLKQYAKDYGYKEGWAAHKYRMATETWPNHYKNVPAITVCEEVWSYVKSLNIKYAKQVRKQEFRPG
ncbi:MAG: DEAD/DEAH box helicase family protein [Patescibacteria group bacterium]|nr:DEAD/DEAH box helicase family protein [Patescibacteria group bacterium]